MEENKPIGSPEMASPVQSGPTVTPPAPKQSKMKSAWEFVRFAVIVGAVVLVVRVFVAQPFVVSGASMVPTYQNSNYLIIDELTYHFRSPQRGDVIVFHPPIDPSTYYIKRVIGVPGDTVIITKGIVSIKNAAHPDGVTIDETYITKDTVGDNFEITVPDGKYFVMGDNRPASYDSRRWGLLPEKNITGRVFLRLFPLNQLGLFPSEHPLI